MITLYQTQTWDNDQYQFQDPKERQGTATSNKYASQSRSGNESAILLKTFGSAEITQDEIKDLGHQGEFINFKKIFHHN